MAGVVLFNSYLTTAITPSYITVAGNVKDSANNNVSRKIIGYRNGDETVLAFSDQSDASGNFSFQTNGNANDRFRVIAIGLAGENSDVKEHAH